MKDPTVRLELLDDDAIDLVCMRCPERSRLHPQEGVIDQVRLFLEQHRHEARQRS